MKLARLIVLVAPLAAGAALLSGCHSRGWCCDRGGTTGTAAMSSDARAVAVSNTKCPVCGKALGGPTAWHTDYDGKTVGFCRGDCLSKWQAGTSEQRATWWSDCSR